MKPRAVVFDAYDLRALSELWRQRQLEYTCRDRSWSDTLGIPLAILSNGTPEMLESAVRHNAIIWFAGHRI
jgi:hypothetical protein